MPLKGGSPIGSSLGNTSSNSFKRFLTIGVRTLGYESVVVHVSVPLQRRVPEGCSNRIIFLTSFFLKFVSIWMTSWEGALFSHASTLSLRTILWFSRFFFSRSLFIFICAWSSTTREGVKGKSANLLDWWVKFFSLVRPLHVIFLSNCQGLPNKIWQASISTTSHKTLPF